MNARTIRYGVVSLIALAILSRNVSLSAQVRPFPEISPPSKPLIKLIGHVDASPPETTPYPVVTLGLPGDEQATFLLTDMRIMAGPLHTPGSILSEVRPYSVNFRVRASWEDVAKITNAAPTEQLEILALYSSADRSLLVKSVEAHAGTGEEDAEG
ncbi:MAG: hypothetical protein AB1671_07785 [Thermodesulfobacteriota bacterium]|jgi:hypothetical protein